MLTLTEGAHVYEQSQEAEQYVYFRDLVLREDGIPFVLHLGTELVLTQTGQDEVLFFELDPDVADDIMDAIDGMQYDMPPESEESDEDRDLELEAAHSETFRQRIVQQREERRVDFIANANLERSKRTRAPSRALREYLATT